PDGEWARHVAASGAASVSRLVRDHARGDAGVARNDRGDDVSVDRAGVSLQHRARARERLRGYPMNRRDMVAGGVAALPAAMLAPRTLAYPDRTVRLVVPFSPGGATDVVGRLWAEKMKPILGTVVTENRGGGGGVTGATEVARAQPDGHTFLFGNTSTQVL